MKKFLLIGLTLFGFFGFVLSPVLGAGNFTPNGNERKGKYLFRKYCRKCHDGSSAKVISPNSKTMDEWQDTFNNYQSLKCKDEWDKIRHKDLNDIFTFLHNHAYDSPQPATCG